MAESLIVVCSVCMSKIRTEPVLIANLLVAVAAIIGLDLDGGELAAAIGTLTATTVAVRRAVSPV